VPRRGSLRWLGRALLLLGSCVLVFGGLELGTRWLEPPPIRPKPRTRIDLPRLQGVADLARPNVEGRHIGVVFRNNSRGFRGPEWTPEPAPGTYRIAITGDSVAAGWGVPVEDAYPSQLETAWRAEGRPIEVLNLALAGANAAGAVGRMAAGLRAYRIDLLVYAHTLNDIEGPAHRPNPKAASQAWIHELKRFKSSRSHFLRWAWPRWLGLRELWMAPVGSPLYEHRDNYYDNPAAWQDFQEALGHFSELAKRAGVCGHVLVQPAFVDFGWRHPYRDLYERVADAAREQGLSASITLPELQGLDVRRLWLSDLDPHPNREGHAALARATALHLERDLPSRCGLPAGE